MTKQANTQLLKEFMTKSIIADEPWPDDTILFQPFEAEQILLAENASCLAIKALLHMSKIPFRIKSCINAEFMSPGGRLTKLPFIKVGAFLIAEFEPIVNFMEQKEIILSESLGLELRGDIRAYVSLVENIFTCAEWYVTFIDKLNYNQITCPRNGCVFPWPLNHYQNYYKKQNVLKQLSVYHWKSMTIDDVVETVGKCCETLVCKLEERESDSPFFFGQVPTEMDAITFGHVFTILTTKLPNNILAETIQKYGPLVQFCQDIDAMYFKKD